MMLNSLSFCLSVKLLSSPSYLNEILAGYSNFFVFLETAWFCGLAVAEWRLPAPVFLIFPMCLGG